MSKILVVLCSNPHQSFDYEQGIELLLNFADAQIEACAYFEGEFLQALKSASKEEIFYKKLKQLVLFEVKCFSSDKTLSLAGFDLEIVDSIKLFNQYQKIVSF